MPRQKKIKERELRCDVCGKIVKVKRYKGGDPEYWCGEHRGGS